MQRCDPTEARSRVPAKRVNDLPAQLRRYHLFLLEERRLAVGTVVTQICALRFFCRYVLKRRDVPEDLPYPKQRLGSSTKDINDGTAW